MKYSGTIAFVHTTQTSPDVWKEQTTERFYTGDCLENHLHAELTSEINMSPGVNYSISIVMDPYLRDNFHHIRWLTFNGAKWTVKTVDVNPPRLRLYLGGLYNVDEGTQG